MKTLEELEMMNAAQLRGIAQSLGGNPATNMAKPKLVQLVYDLQQPTPEETEDGDTADTEGDKPKDFDTAADLDAKLQEIADHYEGEIEPTEEEKEGATIFVVTDVTGEEVAKGTFHELYDHVKAEQAEAAADTGSNGEAAGLSDVPLSDENQEPVDAPAVGDEDNLAQIERGLKPLAALGLRYQIDGSVITLTRGAQTQVTTANQPAHRVVRTAETLCNFR